MYAGTHDDTPPGPCSPHHHPKNNTHNQTNTQPTNQPNNQTHKPTNQSTTHQSTTHQTNNLTNKQILERLLCRCLAPPPPTDPSPRLLFSWSTHRGVGGVVASPASHSHPRERRPTPLLASLGIRIPPAQRKKTAAASKQQPPLEPPPPVVTTLLAEEEGKEEEGEEEEEDALRPDALTALFAPSSSSSPPAAATAKAPPPLRLSYSSLFQYRACPLSYYYAHVLALPTRCVVCPGVGGEREIRGGKCTRTLYTRPHSLTDFLIIIINHNTHTQPLAPHALRAGAARRHAPRAEPPAPARAAGRGGGRGGGAGGV